MTTPTLWRVMAVEEAEDGAYKVTAVKFDPAKYCYVERGEALTTRIQPDLTTPPDPPATISATELQYDDEGTIKAKLFVSWSSVTDVNEYILRYRVDGGAWSDEVEVFTTSYDILEVSAGFYEIEVYSYNVFGIRSTTAATYSLNVEGVVVLPANVTGLTLTVLSLTQVQLGWTLATAADVLTGGEVVLRHDPRPAPTGNWDDANPITINAVAGSESSAIVPRLTGTYFAKFQNQSGLRSETAASVVSTYANPSPVLTIQSWAEEDETPNPFPGTDTNLAYDGGSGGLLLNTAAGEYKASRTLDLQDVYESLVIRRRLISDAIILSGSPDPIDKVEARTFYRTTQGSPLDPEAPHWEDWAEFAHQEIFTARAVELKVEAESTDAEVGQVITDLELELEFAQRTDTGDGTGFTTYTVTFDNPFYVAPTVSITVTDNRPTTFTLGTVTRFGFSIEFFGNGGAPAKRSFAWLATGYGKQIAESLDIDFPGQWDTVGVAWIREGIVEDLGASYVLTGYPVDLQVTVPVAFDAGAYVLTGYDITTQLQTPVDAGSYSLTGQAVAFASAYAPDAGSFAYSLYAPSYSPPAPLLPDAGSFALTGYEATLEFQDVEAWSPDLFSTLEVWYDASDDSTVTLVSGAVSQLDDKTAGAENLTQSTSSKRPTIRSAVLNGLDVLDFDGTDDSLNNTTFTTSQPSTWLAVFKSDKTTGGTADRSAVFDSDSSVSTNRQVMQAYGNNVGYTQIWSGGGFLGNSDNPLTLNPVLSTFCFDNQSSRLQIDDDETQTGSTGSGGMVGFTMGNYYTEAQDEFNGWIAELLIINDSSQHVREMLAGYGGVKWGLLKNLYDTHPYKVHEVPPTAYATIVQMPFEGGADGDTTYRERAANQYTVTFNGAADISSDQAKFGSLSAHFPGGTGDYATILAKDDFKIGPHDFTMECWVYIPSLASAQTIASSRASTSTNSEYWLLRVQSTGQLTFQSRVAGGTQYFGRSGTGLVTANTWHHLCVDRTDGVLRAYVDGAQGTGITENDDGNNPLDFDDDLCLGAFRLSGFASYGNFYMDEFRLIKGTALHQGTGFTPETTPYDEPATARASMLFNFEGANGDTHTTDEGYAYLPIHLLNGAALSTTQAKFGSTSLALDGTNDYAFVDLTGESSMRDWDLAPFTVSMWVYVNSHEESVFGQPMQIGEMNEADDSNYWCFGTNAQGRVEFYYFNGSAQVVTGTTVLSTGAWHHIAMTHHEGDIRLFANGTLETTAAVSGTPQHAFDYLTIGAHDASYLDCFIDGLEINRGRAVWLDDFTVPASASSGDSVTHGQALLQFEGADAATSTTDEGTYGSTFTFGGDAQIDTAQSKFGSSSLLMDGTNDTVRTTDCDAFLWEDRDFTVHFWVRVAGAGPTGAPHLLDFRPTDAGAGPLLYYDRTTRVVSYFTSNAVRITGTALPLNTWAHVALTRHEGTTRLFIDGTQAGSDYADTNVYVTTAGGIGCRYTAISSDDRSLNGHMDAFQAIAGRALWTSEFTPPTSAPS